MLPHRPTDQFPGSDNSDPLLAKRFRLAWLFLLVSAAIGLGLRAEIVRSWSPLAYGHLLHAHSHVALLGGVFNAFVVAALAHFVPPGARRSYDWLWWSMQLAVLGQLASFPFQGYGAISIAFSTLHLVAAGGFAMKLWRHNLAAPAARPHLLGALAFMLLSGAGPLALGPLGAAGLRDAPAYTLAIYFYVHCQATGWFLFFLQALLLQRAHETGAPVLGPAASRAAGWLFSGNLFSFAVSAWWLDPPLWVRTLALLGGTLQLVGVVEFIRACAQLRLPSFAPARLLGAIAITAWLLKSGLHFLGAWPVFAPLLTQRPVAIAFLHLIFLGLVIPALWLWALDRGWLRNDRLFRVGCGLFLIGFVGTETVLTGPVLLGSTHWPESWSPPHGLLLAALFLVTGLALMGRFRPPPPARPLR